MNTMSTEQGRSTVVSRIKALEGQTSTESLGLPKKPEIVPRTVPPRPAVSSGNPRWLPNLQPTEPLENGTPGPQADSGGPTPHSPAEGSKEQPCHQANCQRKPNPGLIRSINLESLGGGPTARLCGGKKAPTPLLGLYCPRNPVSSEKRALLCGFAEAVTVPPDSQWRHKPKPSGHWERDPSSPRFLLSK